ncbi:MAG TPA: ABC transporter substrate-binding protein [Usitatibacter sp.]|nr:ABC transporter substrate-binding protein [Usitatibacter sp.]
MKKTTQILAALAAAFALTGARAQALEEIKVSYQPALYWALPFYIATEKNWWAEVGLKPAFSTFPAGVPQIAASAAKSWDVGGTGSVPAVLGAVRFGIVTIGITNDESRGNALLVRGDKAAAYAANPASMKGQTILLTANSTGDYAVQACLAKYGLKKADVTLKNMGQAEIISAMSSNNAELVGVWAPNTYTLEEKAGAKTMCDGKDGGAIVPGALIARGDYAKEKPQSVAKFLAVYIRAQQWALAHRKEAIAMMKAFYEQGGVTISEAAMNKEFDTRPVFDLDGQLKAMNRGASGSDMDRWFAKIGDFMKAAGSIPEAPAPASFITDAYMKRVEADPKLKAVAGNTH